MNMSVSFLIQATRILHDNDYDDNEVQMIYDYLKTIDNDTLFEYFCTCTIINYDNDLELFVEILDRMIIILEEKEEYEKCHDLQFKKLECKAIKNKKDI